MDIGSRQGLQCNQACVSAQYEKFQTHPGMNLKVNNFHLQYDMVAKGGEETIAWHGRLSGKAPVNLSPVSHSSHLEWKLLEDRGFCFYFCHSVLDR